MSILKDCLPALNSGLSTMRRELGSYSPQAFAEIYLKRHCPLPYSRMHIEIFDLLAGITEKRNSRLAIAAPRGHAKSTIVTLAYVLWCVLYDKERLVLIVSDTKEQAASLLSPIIEQLQWNEKLIMDFPDVCQPEEAGKKPNPWRGNRIKLRNGAMIASYGAGQRLRGAKSGKDRPGLIVVDDLENTEQVISEDQREKLKNWFTRTLLHSGYPETNVVVVGTVLHHESLLANLIDPSRQSGWQGNKYRAIENFSDRPALWDQWSAIYCNREDHEERTGPEAAAEYFQANRAEMLEGTQVLWPQSEDYYALMEMREREGRVSFQAEKQNEPLDPHQCLFSHAKLQYWDDEYDSVPKLLAALGPEGYFYGACDPSLGHRKDRGDYSAIIVMYQVEQTNVNYIIAADLARRSPDETIERIIHYASMYQFDKFGVETNQFQELMVKDIERRSRSVNVHLPIHEITNTSNKRARIANLEPEVCQGRIIFCRSHQKLLEQLRHFPLAKHDDGPDALQMSMETATQPRHLTRCYSV